MIMVIAIFVTVLVIIAVINVNSVRKNSQKTANNIKQSIIAKGKTLSKNNSMAMVGMAEDNAFTAIQMLVSSTVSDDEDIVYGIYMDDMQMPWVYASPDNPGGTPQTREPLKDSIDLWASQLEQQDYKKYNHTTGEVFEFAAPVLVEDEILGHIRYGISTQSMIKSIKEARADGRASLIQTILILLVLLIVSIIAGLFIIRKLATRITKPIGSLVNSTKVIADGDYTKPVQSESNDEIGNLAQRFEVMRTTIKKYTDHLQDLVDEKMQEVNDILNNIDQGLFTINLDGTINEGYSAKANDILDVCDVSKKKIAELLRFDPKQEKSFKTWLNLIQKTHKSQRWKKLEKLAPVHQLELNPKAENDDQKFVSISYQKIYDKRINLSKVMILALDETEKRLKDMQMQEEKERHENEVKTILGIANTPPDEIAEFVDDTTNRIKTLRDNIERHLFGVVKQRTGHPDEEVYTITEDHIDELYRDIHTIKGNAGSYGFELLSRHAHIAEDVLEDLKKPLENRRDQTLKRLKDKLEDMDQVLDDVKQKIKLILGEEEDVSVRVPEKRISKIQEISKHLQSDLTPDLANELAQECEVLSWKPLKTLMRKYQKAVQKAARKLGKDVEFSIENDQQMFPPSMFNPLDEAIIHITRNAIDHGIESPEIRQETEKGPGHIAMSVVNEEGKWFVKVVDDGHGIDCQQLVEKCIGKNIITKEQSEEMSDKDKFNLLFNSGVSTAAEVTDISGRGMGMDIVYHKIKELGGSIDIDSTLGKGSSFTISVPEGVLGL